LGNQIPTNELILTYASAIEFLKDSEDPAILKRVMLCSESLLAAWKDANLEVSDALEKGWEGFFVKERSRTVRGAADRTRIKGFQTSRLVPPLGFSVLIIIRV